MFLIFFYNTLMQGRWAARWAVDLSNNFQKEKKRSKWTQNTRKMKQRYVIVRAANVTTICGQWSVKVWRPWRKFVYQVNPYPDRIVLRSTRIRKVHSYPLWRSQLVTSHLVTDWLTPFKGRSQLVPWLNLHDPALSSSLFP